MPNLVFDTGFKEFDINGDKTRTIRVNVSDWNVIKNISELRERIATRVSKLKELKDGDDFNFTIDKLSEVEREVREEVDSALGSPVCDTAFGKLNCLSFAGGQPIVLNFLEAILPELMSGFEEETKQAEEKASKYVSAVEEIE